MPEAAGITAGPWSGVVGDPTVTGWMATVLYLTAAGLAMRLAWRLRRSDPAAGCRFWWIVAAALLLLGINKQLDLQSWLTIAGRAVVSELGWSGFRRELQFGFVALLTGLIGVSLALLARRMRRGGPGVRIAGFGLALLAVFIVVRASRFHHVLDLGNATFGAENWVEWCGILTTAAGAIRALQGRRRSEAVSAAIHGQGAGSIPRSVADDRTDAEPFRERT